MSEDPENKQDSHLCEPGYYVARWGWQHQVMRIRRRVGGHVKHNYGWSSVREWLRRDPEPIQEPTIWDRVSNLI